MERKGGMDRLAGMRGQSLSTSFMYRADFQNPSNVSCTPHILTYSYNKTIKTSRDVGEEGG